MRLAIAAFIAGGSLLLFLPTVPDYWLSAAIFTVAIALLGLRFFSKATSSQHIFIILICAALGFAWNAKYADDRLNNILSEELEGQELSIEGRVAALPQSSSAGAKFAFEVRQALLSGDKVEEFPERIYLSWQPAWRNAQEIPEVIPGQRWKFKVKLKRPYGSLNPYTFDFERWSFHQNFGASGSVRSGELLLEKDIGLTDFELAMEYQRWKLRKKIQRLLPQDAAYAGVIVALVMGDQNAIDQADWRVFNATGIGHLISIKCIIYLS